MRGCPELEQLFEPEVVGRPCPIEAIERWQEHFEVSHDVVSALRAQKGAPLIKHFGRGAIWEVIAAAGDQTSEVLIQIPVRNMKKA